MKSLEFEKISVSDVRREIDGQRKRNRGAQAGGPAHAAGECRPADETSRWIAELPANVRPIALARKFPRIANSIAELWRRVARCEEYLDTLVVDLRGDRSGFPPDVAQELRRCANTTRSCTRSRVRPGISSRRTDSTLSSIAPGTSRVVDTFFCRSLLFSTRNDARAMALSWCTPRRMAWVLLKCRCLHLPL